MKKLLILSAIMASMGSFSFVHADSYTIASQGISSYMSAEGLFGGMTGNGTSQTCGVTDSVGVGNYQPLGTGLSGSPTDLLVSLSENQGFAVDNITRYFRVCLIESTTSGTSTVTGNYARYDYVFPANMPQTVKSASSTSYGGTWTSGYELDSDRYYGFVIISNSSQIGKIWGTSAGSFGRVCYSTGFSCDVNFKAIRYLLRGESVANTPLVPFAPYTWTPLGSSTLSTTFSNALTDISAINEDNATTSATAGLQSFYNVPSYFANRVPFGYIYDVYDIWNNVSTSTAEFGTLSIDFDSLDLPTSTRAFLPGEVIFFSTSTVTSYVDDTLLDLLNALASAGIAITFMLSLFRKATTVIKPI